MPPISKRPAKDPMEQLRNIFGQSFPGIAAKADAEAGARPKKGAKPPPLWKGPEEDGITFSLLSRFLVCRERFRLQVVEGLVPADGFNHRIEYGSMWHVCEESWAKLETSNTHWKGELKRYCEKLSARYPTATADIQHWMKACLTQFPHYTAYWAKHPDVKARTPAMSEVAFAVPYHLPSGRTVLLRGKWDSVDIVGKGKDRAIWLQENKTKGDVDAKAIGRQLTFDLQTMIYLVALKEWQDQDGIGTPVRVPGLVDLPLAGVRYNVIRRPLSGGKGSIKQKQGETEAAFWQRLGEYFAAEPEAFFMRWNVPVTAGDRQQFRHQTLDPVLEQLCDWWEAVKDVGAGDPFGITVGPTAARDKARGHAVHWRHPFGVWNVLDEGGASDLDEYLQSGSTAGLRRADTLFPELEGG